MSRYVNIDFILNETDEFGYESGVLHSLSGNSAPSIDICFCKDCKHNPKYTKDFMYGECPFCCEDDYYATISEDDFFCKRGERRE